MAGLLETDGMYMLSVRFITCLSNAWGIFGSDNDAIVSRSGPIKLQRVLEQCEQQLIDDHSHQDPKFIRVWTVRDMLHSFYADRRLVLSLLEDMDGEDAMVCRSISRPLNIRCSHYLDALHQHQLRKHPFSS